MPPRLSPPVPPPRQVHTTARIRTEEGEARHIATQSRAAPSAEHAPQMPPPRKTWHRPGWLKNIDKAESLSRPFTKKEKELKLLMEMWDIDFSARRLTPEDADALLSALRLFSLMEHKDDLTKEKNLTKPCDFRNLHDGASFALSTGERNWLEAYKTLARLRLVNPNQYHQEGPCLLQLVIGQRDQFAGCEAGEIAAPRERLEILLTSGANVTKSRLEPTELIQSAQNAGNDDMLAVLNALPEAVWDAWSKEPGPSRDGRCAALYRMRDWVERNTDNWSAPIENPEPLALTSLQLDSLPRVLPAGIRDLKIERNFLQRLPPLPHTLKYVDASNNRLELVEGPLPEALVRLFLKGNDLLRNLPLLPPTMCFIDVRGTDLLRTVSAWNPENAVVWI